MMKKYVVNEEANKQINLIADLLEQKYSNDRIASKLVADGVKNLANDDGLWSASDIEKIRIDFNLKSDNKSAIVAQPGALQMIGNILGSSLFLLVSFSVSLYLLSLNSDWNSKDGGSPGWFGVLIETPSKETGDNILQIVSLRHLQERETEYTLRLPDKSGDFGYGDYELQDLKTEPGSFLVRLRYEWADSFMESEYKVADGKVIPLSSSELGPIYVMYIIASTFIAFMIRGIGRAMAGSK